MSDLKQRLLKKIEKEHVKPTPKSYFIIKNLTIWGLGVLFLLLGIIATTLIFYISDNLELLSIIMETPRMLPKIILVGLPSVWIVLSIIFAFIAGTSLQKTKKGYRLPIIWILVIIFSIQILGGFILSKTNFPSQIEHSLHKKMRMANLERRKELLWRTPEAGFMVGIVKEISEKENWILIDFNGEEWTLKTNDETHSPRNFNIRLNQKILVKGEIINQIDKTFDAQQIMPFLGLRQKMRFQPRNKDFPAPQNPQNFPPFKRKTD